MANVEYISSPDDGSKIYENMEGVSNIVNVEDLLYSFENLSIDNIDLLNHQCSQFVFALKNCKPNESSILISRWENLYQNSGKIISERSVLSATLLYSYCLYLSMTNTKIDYNLIICLLERVLKSSPTNSQAWNELGECYWNIGKPQQACDSFLASIQHDSNNKESLRNLAIIFRQLHPPNSTEYSEDLKTSFKYAQLAVNCDKDDGMSWVILGNTILSQHFQSTESSPFLLNKCLVCYRIAENDLLVRKSPDFYNNLGTVYICLENYSSAVQSYSEASKLNDQSDNAQKKLSSLLQTFKSIHKAIESSRKLSTFEMCQYTKKCASLPTDGTYDAVNISKLEMNQSSSSTSLTLCVIQEISQNDMISCISVCVDLNCTIGICNLHGIKQTGVFKKGDVITIFSPVFKQQHIDTKCGIRIDIPWISCTNPELIRVNGKSVPGEFIIKAIINIHAYT